MKIYYDLTIAGHQFYVHYDCSTAPKPQQSREGKGNTNCKRKGVKRLTPHSGSPSGSGKSLVNLTAT